MIGRKITLALAFFANLWAEAALAEDAIKIDVNDPKFEVAIDEARRTLPIFLTHALHPNGEGLLEASLKVSFEVQKEQVVNEYVWIGPFKENDDGTFSGFLANDPVHLDAKFGEEITFSIEQILDWQIWLEDQKTYGSFTTRAILEYLPEARADEIRDELSQDPVPEDWLE